MKTEQICRTCLVDDGNFFDISHIFDENSIAQMIRDITDLQIEYSDGFTQSVCFKCVKEVRKAHKFRRKCIESSHNLIKIDTIAEFLPLKPLEDISVMSENKVELPRLEDIKQEVGDSCDVEVFLKEENDDNDSYKPSSPDSDCDIDDYDESTDDNIIEVGRNKKNKFQKSTKIIFDCPLCHGILSSDKSFNKHIYELHPDRVKDEIFAKEFVPIGFIVKEETKLKFKNVYKCALDDFAGNSLDEFKRHMREKHIGGKPVLCIECGFRTRDIPQLKNHRALKHSDEKKFFCSECDYSGKTQKALKIHTLLHSMERNYKCKLCTLTFKRPSDLSVHKKIKHEKRRSHVCTICQKAFFHSKVLKNHMAVHTGEKPHICHICGHAFSQNSNLKKHVSLMHEPVKVMFKCELCNYSAKQKVQLIAHVKTHTGEKEFECPHCPFRTSKNSSLKLHVMRHFGQKRFSCDLCDYKCMTPFELKIHKRSHTGERPFPCTICAYRAKSQFVLKLHMQTHDTELKFACPHCPYRSNVKNALRKHLRKMCIVKKRGRPPSKPSEEEPELNDVMKNNSENQVIGMQ